MTRGGQTVGSFEYDAKGSMTRRIEGAMPGLRGNTRRLLHHPEVQITKLRLIDR
jgi:hypothetical protein